MRYRVTLTNPILGSLILEREPKGLSDLEPVIRRGENHGLTEEIDVKLEFYCGAGKEFIDQVRDEQGIDGEILIDIDAACGCDSDSGESLDYSIDYSDDYGSQTGEGCTYEEFYLGTVDLKGWETDDTFTKVPIIQRGILQTVKNRLDTKVDLFNNESLDGTTFDPLTYLGYDLTLHSKALLLRSEFLVSENPATSGGVANGGFVLVQIPFSPVLTELFDAFSLGADFITSGSVDPLFTNAQQTTEINVEHRIKGTLTLNAFAPTAKYNITQFQILRNMAGDVDLLFTSNSGGQFTGDYTFNFDLSDSIDYASPAIGAELKFYMFLETEDPDSPDIDPLDNFPFTLTLNLDTDNSFVNVQGVSITDPTEAKAALISEAGSQIARIITDQEDSFRSTYYGRTDSEPHEYAIDGCGSKRAITNGFMVRGFPTTGDNARTVRLSMNDYFRGLNAIDNLGMGVEKVDGEYYITIERKEYFYDASTVLLTLNNVPGLKRTEAPDYYYNRINIGYEAWETEFTNGLDEFNSKRQYDTLIKAVDNPLTQHSSFVASGYRLEVARRKQYSDSFTEDSENDEDNFIICLNLSDVTIAEKDENFVGPVENILSPETSYNLSISPERNYLRWNNVINAGLAKHAGREVKFTSGEGNYKMVSEYIDNDCPGSYNNATLTAGANLQWDDANNLDKDPIWYPEILDFDFPLTWTEYKLIKANPKGVIEVSEDEENHIKGFILELKYKPGGVSNFKLLRAFE
jgi:hypothetical protein